MTNVEHMIAWIESSRPHYDGLLALERDRKQSDYRGNAGIAHRALGIVTSAYREATFGGDMFAKEWNAADLLDAAKELLTWELEQ